MKKRVLFISLALVVLLTALLPAAALAKNDRGFRPAKWERSLPVLTDFSGAGLVWVTYMPPPVIKGKMWHYYGEIVEGVLHYCDWEPLLGAAFWSDHDSFVIVQNDGSARGIMKGNFTLTGPDGKLEGFFEGRITGNIYTGFISDQGTWFSTGGTGAFAGVKAWGRWSADLSYDPGYGTLIGQLTWQGKYLK
jgi:hypothetical protein